MYYSKSVTKNIEYDEMTSKNVSSIEIFKDPFIMILTISNFCFYVGYINTTQHVKVIINKRSLKSLRNKTEINKLSRNQFILPRI